MLRRCFSSPGTSSDAEERSSRWAVAKATARQSSLQRRAIRSKRYAESRIDSISPPRPGVSLRTSRGQRVDHFFSPAWVFAIHLFHELVERGGLRQNFLCLGLCCYVSVGVVDGVPLAPARLKVIGIVASRGPKRQPCALQGNPMMADPRSDAVSGARNRHDSSLAARHYKPSRNAGRRTARQSQRRQDRAQSDCERHRPPSSTWCASAHPCYPVILPKSPLSPFTNCLGPRTTAARKWSRAATLDRNSRTEEDVTFISLPSRSSARRRAGASSARPTLPMTIKSTSLRACSSPRATEP